MCPTPDVDKNTIRTKNGDVEANLPAEGGKAEIAEPSRPRTLASLIRRLVAVVLRVMVASTIMAALVGVLWYYMGFKFVIQLVIVAFVAYLAAGGGYKWFYVAFMTAPRDLRALFKYLMFLFYTKRLSSNNATVASVFKGFVDRNPEKVCFYYEDTKWTRKQIDELSNRVANFFMSQGLRRGDSVALVMTNQPEYVAIWLGLSKIGVITALINTNLRLKSLLHCIEISNAKAVIFSDNMADALIEIAGELGPRGLYSWGTGGPSGSRSLGPLIAATDSTPPIPQTPPGHHDRLLYIYTSGTTGLPKAAVITNSRYISLSMSLSYMVGLTSKDKTYTCLPLYHTAGGCLGVGQALLCGGCVVVRTKFSASNYFPDIIKYECTVAQYIGEMCRYVLATTKKPQERNHKLKVIFGNGLRPQIWKEFVDRFNIPRVGEFYGATEGNANIINIDNKEGAIGFVSRIIPSLYPISIIKVDEATGEPVRNSKGLCQLCKPGEPGAFVGKILPNNPTRAFLGYVNAQESEKKIVRDVFHNGDQAFISGDILDSDDFGYLYFKDRTGDTFRWKGENVSTTEVEGVVSNVVSYRDCVVYGVQVGSSEGRAGMAAVVDKDGSLDMDQMAEGIKKALPTYARPLFVRVMESVEMTGTYKMKKLDLQKEGFDPTKIKDKLYYLTANQKYEPLDNDIFSQIETGKLRL